MKNFIPREKLGKKAKQELDRQQRKTWGISPISRKNRNGRAYDRKRSQHRPDDGDTGALLF